MYVTEQLLRIVGMEREKRAEFKTDILIVKGENKAKLVRLISFGCVCMGVCMLCF